MASIFGSKDSVFFIGGITGQGSKTGLALAGGCTKDFLEANGGESFFDLSAIMGPNGEAIDSATNAVVTISGNTIITKVGAFTNTLVGMVAFVAGTIFSDRYEVLGRTDDSIEISSSAYISDASDITVNVGGAFDDIDSVVGNVAASFYNVDVYTNKTKTLNNSSIDISSGGGSVDFNTFLRFISFNTALNDMLFGGDFYQSPFDAHMNGVDETKSVVIDADNSMVGIKSTIIIGDGSIILVGFYCKNNNTGTAFNLDGNYSSLINCKSKGNTTVLTRGSIGGTATLGIFITDFYCVEGNETDIQLPGEISLFNSIIDSRNHNFAGNAVVSTGLCSVFENNLILGAANGIVSFGTAESIRNNTLYGQTLKSLRLRGATDNKIIAGNILVPIAGAKAINIDSQGTSIYNDYNCIYGADGNPLADPFGNDVAGGHDPVLGRNSIEEAPLFIDASSGDFRILPTSPCVNTADRDAQDGYNTMGCWMPKNKLVKNNWSGPNGWMSSFKH